MVATVVAVSNQVERIDLPSAIDQALRQNRAFQQSVSSIQAALLATESARAEFDVRFVPTGSAEYHNKSQDTIGTGLTISKRKAWGTTLESGADLTRNRDFAGTNVFQGQLYAEINQPLFRNFGREINEEPVLAAESKGRAARRLVEMQRADLALKTIETYVNLLNLGGEIENAQATVTRAEQLFKLTAALEKLGRASRVDSLRVEQQKGDALALLAAKQESYGSRMKDFAELLGADVRSEFNLVPVPRIGERTLPDEEYVGTALSNRLDFAQVLDSERDAARGVRIGQRKLLPELELTTRYELTSEEKKLESAGKLDDHTWFVALKADTDLGRHKERVALSQALLDKETAAETVRMVEQGITKQVLQYLSARRNSVNQEEMARKNFDLARSRLDLARRMFQDQRGDSLSVSDAETAYLQAESALLAAQSEAAVSVYRLRHALGTLVESPDWTKLSAQGLTMETAK